MAALDTRQMQQDLAAATAPTHTKSLIQSILTTLPSPALAAALRRSSMHPRPPPTTPWALPDWEAELRATCGVAEAGGGVQGLLPLLQGSVEVQSSSIF